MNKFKFNYLSLITMIAFGLTACSMKDRTEVHSVSVQLPQEWAKSSSKSMASRNYSSMKSSFPAPTADIGTSFQCYGLNIIGPGISSDPIYQCKNPASGMGILAGLAPITVGSLDAMVPAGPARTVQLLGVQSDIACPILSAYIEANGIDSIHGHLEAYVLGSTTTDIFDDTAVTIAAAFDANTAKAFQGCGNGNGGGSNQTPTLQFQMPGNQQSVVNIQANNYCMPISIGANNGGMPSMAGVSVKPVIVSDVAGGVTTFYSGSCNAGNEVTNYISFPANNNQVQLYVQSVPAATGGSLQGKTFVAKVITTATGWNTPSTTFGIVDYSLQITGTVQSNYQTGSCVSYSYQKNYGNYISSTSGGTANLTIGRDNVSGSSGSPLALHVFSGLGCATGSELTGVSQNNGSSYSYGLTYSSGSGSFSFIDSNSEKLYLNLLDADTGTTASQAVGMGVSFLPFTASPTYSPGPVEGGGTLSLYLNGSAAAAISAVLIGGQNCVIPTTGGIYVSGSTVSVNCISPPSPSGAPGSFPVSVILGSGATATTYNLGFGFNYFQTYQFTQNTPVSVVLATGASACIISGTLPSSSPYFSVSLDANHNCVLTGTPTASYAPSSLTFPSFTLSTVSGCYSNCPPTIPFNISIPAITATLSSSQSAPAGIAVDNYGNIFIADTGHNIIQMKLAQTSGIYYGVSMTTGNIYTIAGAGGSGLWADGVNSAARFNAPQGIAVDSSGNVYVADSGNHRIRMIPSSSNYYFGISMSVGSTYTIAGTSTGGFNGTGGTALSINLNNPTGVAVDTSGNIYIADNGNNRIRKIIGNTISTIAGTGASSSTGDGYGANLAAVNGPKGLVYDPNSSSIYFTQSDNRIRVINYSGIINLFAGTGASGDHDDIGVLSTFNQPFGITAGSYGVIYVADSGNHKIRKIAGGVVTTIAGSGATGNIDDGASALLSLFNNPTGIACYANGNALYVSDQGNNAIRSIH